MYKKNIPINDLNRPTERELPPSDNVIEPAYREKMNILAQFLDDQFNGNKEPKRVAFVMLISEFGNIDANRVNYISNGRREDIVTMMREILARFEGQPEMKGEA